MAKNHNQTKKQTNKTVIYLVIGAVVLLLLGIGAVAYILTHGDDKNSETAEATPTTEAEEYDPLDCVTLGKYQGIEVSLAVEQDEIDSEIDDLLDEHATYEELSGVVADGDTVYAEFEGYIDGQKVDTTCGSDYVDIGSGEWLDGFESGIIGASTGETVSFTIPVPAGTYGDDTIDGHDVEFHVTVDYICGEEILPEYNDDFVQSISKKYKTVKEYNAYIKRKLTKEYKEQKAENTWTKVLALCDVTDYPKSLLQIAREENLQDYYGMAELYGVSRDELFASFGYEDEADFTDNALDELAKDSAKEYLVAEAIAEKEGISYSDSDYSDTLAEEYSYVEDSYDSQEAYEAENKEQVERKALLAAVKEWLAKQAKYTY